LGVSNLLILIFILVKSSMMMKEVSKRCKRKD
jgi:hypothetical protein